MIRALVHPPQAPQLHANYSNSVHRSQSDKAQNKQTKEQTATKGDSHVKAISGYTGGSLLLYTGCEDAKIYYGSIPEEINPSKLLYIGAMLAQGERHTACQIQHESRILWLFARAHQFQSLRVN